MNLDNLSFLRVTKGFVFKPFNCEDDDLNEFLFEEAIPYRKELLATTFVIEDDTRTLDYYSLLNDSLQLKEEMFSSKSQLKKFLRDLIPYPKRHLKNIPSVKIGRLAVDKSCKGKGLGKIMIHTIISNCLMLNDNQACRLITVDAYKQAIPFYQRMGFEFLSDNDKEDSTRLMFLDLADLEE
ncbi:GNAT family N-acetyltransferase [Capnocytophaga sp. oral taxon 326]|jgi:acetyltransferase, GNAT family|uniref:GNAT family N-acetyltransferase n=1 Tax=Capnocytophaga sp. oral taxon 326 TaxID=712212 RepID=UPI0002A2EB86|nr:GNAT family N-acetyltransferase [Capnocytophaga sp. oral taxon 326]EKY16953.1 acetyltransferase, GNAT family [Capnocytophaga sp. oral taxon 326 str. F0382]